MRSPDAFDLFAGQEGRALLLRCFIKQSLTSSRGETMREGEGGVTGANGSAFMTTI